MRRHSTHVQVHKGLAILAGAFSFAGSVGAATIISEGFEGAANIFSAPTYAYSLNYTLPNPGGGLNYMHGGAGIANSASTSVFTAGSPLSLLVGNITPAGIDSGLVTYNLYAQFSTYLAQGDYGTVHVRFLDGANVALSADVTVGGSAFVSALGTDPLTGNRAWGADSISGLVPPGARFIEMSVFEDKTPSGLIIDGYVDNINFSIAVVPEPSTAALFGLGSSLLWFWRRRR